MKLFVFLFTIYLCAYVGEGAVVCGKFIPANTFYNVIGLFNKCASFACKRCVYDNVADRYQNCNSYGLLASQCRKSIAKFLDAQRWHVYEQAKVKDWYAPPGGRCDVHTIVTINSFSPDKSHMENDFEFKTKLGYAHKYSALWEKDETTCKASTVLGPASFDNKTALYNVITNRLPGGVDAYYSLDVIKTGTIMRLLRWSFDRELAGIDKDVKKCNKRRIAHVSHQIVIGSSTKGYQFSYKLDEKDFIFDDHLVKLLRFDVYKQCFGSKFTPTKSIAINGCSAALTINENLNVYVQIQFGLCK